MNKAFYIFSASVIQDVVAPPPGPPHINLGARFLDSSRNQRNRRQNIEVEVAAEYGSNWDVRNVRFF